VKNKNRNELKKQLPISKNEDVEYASELADGDDIEAVNRAHEADRRQEK
jgi:hypothetical protein